MGLNRGQRNVVMIMILVAIALLVIYELAPDMLKFIGDYFTVFALVALIILIGSGRKVK